MCSKTKICADCSATDPKWGILNKGVLVCDACCSIHRSLGRHISQVKYLEPSTWPPSLLSMLMTLTNGGAPSLWEHSLCESKTKKKPVPSDPLHYMPVIFFIFQDKGNRPLHVAASAGQLLQLELLMIYGADAHLLDSRGNTVLNLCTTDAIRDRLVHCMYEATDRFIHYLTGITPDHANNRHYILPHTQCNKTDARHKLMKLSNSLLEDLVMDVYDELDRREVESIWQSVCQPPVGYVFQWQLNEALSNSLLEDLVMDVYDELDRREMLMTLTNGGAPSLWEHSLCESKTKKKPVPSDPLHPTKAEFIKAKYEQLSFMIRSNDTQEELNQQLHSSVRTSNLDTSLRLLSQGADPNYFYQGHKNQQRFYHVQRIKKKKKMISEAHITHLNNEIAKLKTQVQQVIGENETLKAALNARNSATHHQPPETEPVSDSSWCSPQRPASMYNVTVNAQSTTTRMPQSEEVVRRTDQVTKRIQELAAHMRSSDKCHSFVPHAERIRIAVSELSAIFPQNTNNDLIRHALRSLNTSTVRLQAECAQLEGSAERVRSCAYNMAKANKQLLTQFQ
ncbi:ARF GTPase-activating protein GIT2 [Diaphorina citri]|uniref:ARF GTPase-activating protein GIT2 n=1 Tax=Diaphorina citri TaxID=121845 RepID=A0A3Q0J5D3_DIACI|nr:ARF GTPase-activating protein GIT2 [Diaphorina citri]